MFLNVRIDVFRTCPMEFRSFFLGLYKQELVYGHTRRIHIECLVLVSVFEKACLYPFQYLVGRQIGEGCQFLTRKKVPHRGGFGCLIAMMIVHRNALLDEKRIAIFHVFLTTTFLHMGNIFTVGFVQRRAEHTRKGKPRRVHDTSIEFGGIVVKASSSIGRHTPIGRVWFMSLATIVKNFPIKN